MKIKDAREAYFREDKRGYKMGQRAFKDMTKDELYETARNLAKQTNRQFKNMLKADFRSPAVRGLLKSVSGNSKMSGKSIEEIYQQGAIKPKKTSTEAELREQISQAMDFMSAKTHTQKGTIVSELKAVATLAKTEDAAGRAKVSIDISSLTRTERNDMWETINDLMEKNTEFRYDWYVRSAEILEEIVNHIGVNAVKPADVVKEFLKREGYDDGDNNENKANATISDYEAEKEKQERDNSFSV